MRYLIDKQTSIRNDSYPTSANFCDSLSLSVAIELPMLKANTTVCCVCVLLLLNVALWVASTPRL